MKCPYVLIICFGSSECLLSWGVSCGFETRLVLCSSVQCSQIPLLPTANAWWRHWQQQCWGFYFTFVLCKFSPPFLQWVLNQLADFSLTWEGRGSLDIKVLSACVETEFNQREFPDGPRQISLPFSKKHNYFKVWTLPYATWSKVFSLTRECHSCKCTDSLFRPFDVSVNFSSSCVISSLTLLMSTCVGLSQTETWDLSPPQGGPRGLGNQPEVTYQGGDPWKGEVTVFLGRLSSPWLEDMNWSCRSRWNIPG